MSLPDFQRALADLVASPELCLAARRDAGEAFAGYDLDRREHTRLAAMAKHSGMSTNCTMYRAYRTGAAVAGLPQTCLALGDSLRQTLEAFWGSQPSARFQRPVETRAFAVYLRQHVANRHRPELHATLDADLATLAARYGEPPPASPPA